MHGRTPVACGIDLSIVVPLFNEARTLDELDRRLIGVVILLGLVTEIIYVDDGSTDGSSEALAVIARRDARVRVVSLARHYGHTTALAAGFAAARGNVIVAMDVYGDLHRLILAPADWNGARIAEVPIANIRWPQHRSPHSLSRAWRVIADLITVRFLLKYATRPLHLFGPPGFICVAFGAAIATWIVAMKLATGTPIFLEHGPLLLLSALLLQSGIVLFGLGLLAEWLTRIFLDGHPTLFLGSDREQRSPGADAAHGCAACARSHTAPTRRATFTSAFRPFS
jgi:hypothetical protein